MDSKLKKLLFICIFLPSITLIPYCSFAACTGSSPTWTSTADRTSVAACVLSATGGDTLNISAGSETWTSAVTVDKQLEIVGAGDDSTIITNTTSAYSFIFTTGADDSELSDIKLSGGSAIYGGIQVRGTAQGIILHDIYFGSVPIDYFLDYGDTWSEGLIYDCTLFSSVIAVNNKYTDGYSSYGSSPWLNYGIWNEDTPLGSIKPLIVEDCTYTRDVQLSSAHMCDGRSGGAIVIRYCTVDGSLFELHGTGSPNADFRGARFFEFYRNSMLSRSETSYVHSYFRIRSGTGVVFDTTMTGYTSAPGINFDIPRANHPTGITAMCSDCDGGSDVDGNETGESGWLCRDQPGSGRDASEWAVWESSPDQASEPIYGWGNTYNAAQSDIKAYTGTGDESHFEEERDYYNENDSFDGTTGVGIGVLASRPATCTEGVAYWATDQGDWCDGCDDGLLYKCTSTDTWEVFYTPRAYPDPRRSGDPEDTTAPTVTNAIISTVDTAEYLIITLSESCVHGAGGSGGWALSLSEGACTATYSSGSGSNVFYYSLSRRVELGETGTYSYTQPTNGVEDDAGNDLATISSEAVNNGSVYTPSGETPAMKYVSGAPSITRVEGAGTITAP